MGETEMTEVKPTHLDDVEAQVDPEEDEETRRLRDMERTLWTRIWQGVAMACAGLNIASMIWEWSTIALIAGVIAIVVSAGVFYFQFELQDTDSLRMVQNDLRHEVNDFAITNEKFAKENNELKSLLTPLKETSDQLEAIAEKSGTNVEKLKGLVQENKKIQAEQKKILNDDVVQAMADCVLDAERSEDGTFSDREARMLMIKLKGLPQIEVHEERLERELESHRSIGSIMQLVRTVTDETIPEDDRLFSISEVPEDLA